jgi:hypothetical protein
MIASHNRSNPDYSSPNTFSLLLSDFRGAFYSGSPTVFSHNLT